MKKELKNRLRYVAVFLLCIVVLLLVRLYYVQVVQGESYALAADRQYVMRNDRLFDRGNIYFTNKDDTTISGATLLNGFTIAVVPTALKADVAVYRDMLALLNITEADFETITNMENDSYEVLARRVSEEVGQSIRQMNLAGVLVERERWRVYPSKDLGAHTVGFIGYNDDNQVVGISGIERYYEETLRRADNGLFTNFFAELFANVKKILSDGTESMEGDIVTSIEPVVLEKLSSTLTAVHEQYGSIETGGIIMDPATGEIIAMHALPTFDPNNIPTQDPDTFQNPLVEKRYEFGSIVKALTVASGIDAGVVSRSTTYNDTGCLTLDTETVCNYDKRARGTVPMQEVLNQSLNTGVAFIAERMGHTTFRSYFESFGLGDVTGIDLPGEVSGTIDNIASTDRSIEYATAAYGQGIAQSPIGMIRALSALANDGVMATPHVGKKISYSTGLSRDLPYTSSDQIIKPETATIISQMLTTVVDDALVGGSVSIDTMSVAAKTGTAQMADGSGGYYEERYMHSIFGYFPSEQPRYIILLYTRAPQGVQYASETLAKPLMEMVDFLIQYYAIPPDRSV